MRTHRSSPHLLGSATPPDPLTFGSLSWPIPAARSAPSRPGTKGGVAPRPAQVRRLVLRGLRIEPWLLQRGICPTWRSLQAARHNSYERLGFLRACRELGGFRPVRRRSCEQYLSFGSHPAVGWRTTPSGSPGIPGTRRARHACAVAGRWCLPETRGHLAERVARLATALHPAPLCV